MRLAPALLLLCALVPCGRASADSPGLRNADLREWKEGRPVHWSVDVGARNGDGPASRLEPVEGGGVRLAGDAATRVWSMLAQRLETAAGGTYRLSFEMRAEDLRREGAQFDNVYVGVRLGVEGGRPDYRTDVPARPTWTPGEIVFRGSGRGDEVALFLSKSGTFEARRFALEALAAEDAFDVLVRNMSRYYAQFAARPDVNWAALVKAHRAKFPADGDAKAFLPAAVAMLSALKDPHVWIRTPDGKTVPTWAPDVPRTVDFRVLAKSLRDVRQIGKVAFTGSVGDDVGYVAIGSLALDAADASALGEAWRGLLARRGLLIDLRANGGGAEARAAELVASLVDAPRVYARRRVRTGPDAKDLSAPFDATIAPAGGKPFAGPIVVLIGPGCMSSGEGMAQMLRVLPNATFVGAPTRGASGNPAPVDLPNGLSVWYSRWIDELPDGTVLENRGVTPDVPVAYSTSSSHGDTVFTAGVNLLREKLAK